MNHCLLEVDVLEAPQVRYTQDNQTPVAEMTVRLDGLRPDDPPGQLKVVGWGNLAQDLQNRVQVGQRLMIEGRLRMNTVTRADGLKEKRAEFTLARLHPLAAASPTTFPQPSPSQPTASQPALSQPSPSQPSPAQPAASQGRPSRSPAPLPAVEPAWNASPLVPDLPEGDDDIPF